MEGASTHHETSHIKLSRKVYDESLFTTVLNCSAEGSSGIKHYFHTVYSKLTSCLCSRSGVSRFLFRLFPILRWLPKYSVKDDLIADITGGVTVGIMHIPQGN